MSDLVSSSLTQLGGASKAIECFQEERLDVVGLKPSSLGAFHLLANAEDSACVHRVVGECALFHQFLQMGTVQCVGHDLIQTVANLWTLAITDRLNKQIPQRPSTELDFAQDIKYLTIQRLTGLIELFQQRPVNVPFAGLVGDKVPEMADLRLPDAVDATEALFDPVGIPRQVVVHHEMCALEVYAFAGSIGREEHLHIGVVAERLLRLRAMFPAHGAVNQNHRLITPKQGCNSAVQIIESIAMLREYN